MDLGAPGSAPAPGAVACPVCTLYLREGISLQKHLDTHPKEQVIEALIKASSGVSSIAQPAHGHQTTTGPTPPPPAPQVPAPSPYPIGPVFECPPINAMMPPQFASFSYQQFVNNGTMMIPTQYAMASPQPPQASQMMQMLYNPYGMYHQQQIPTVQMISPIAAMQASTTAQAAIPAPRLRTPVSTPIPMPEPRTLPGVPVAEPAKQVLPQMLPKPERVLPDIEMPLSPESPAPELIEEQDPVEDRIQVEHREQQTQNSCVQEESTTVPKFHMEINACTDDNAERILPDIEDTEDPRMVTVSEIDKTLDDGKHLETALEVPDEPITEEENLDKNECNENLEQIRASDTQTKNNNAESSSEMTEIPIHEPLIEEAHASNRPDVEQLECLLRTIMETDFNSVEFTNKDRNCQEVCETIEDKSSQNEEKEVEEEGTNKDRVSESEASDIEEEEAIVSETKAELYRYKNSRSVPCSPIMSKKVHRTFSRASLRSDYGSTESICLFPIGFEATTLQDYLTEAKDNYSDEDMELEEPQSSVLRLRTDASKGGSPRSQLSYSHMDSDGSCSESEESLHEKDPISSAPVIRERKGEAEKFDSVENSQEQVTDFRSQHRSVIAEYASPFPTINQHSHQDHPVAMHEAYPLSNSETSHNLLNISESMDPMTSSDSKSYLSSKPVLQKPTTELLNINEDAHTDPLNVFEFDGLQILVPSTFISESSQKAVSGTSQQSLDNSETGAGNDEEVKSVNMRTDETMPPRGELSEQESNGCTEQSAWQLYMGQESSRMSTSYDLMARESWEESEGSDNEMGGPLLDSRSLATHFTSSLFLDRDRKTPTRRVFKCSQCTEVFDCPKERRVHSTTVHKEAGPSSSRDNMDHHELKDIKLLDGRANVFEEIFVPGGLHIQQTYHHQQPLLHQLQPPQHISSAKADGDMKADGLSAVVDVVCTLCNQRFTSEKSLQIHHRRMHVTETMKRVRENAKCQICNEEFSSVAAFNAHLKIHPLECGQCGKYFYRKQNFKLHMKRHLGIKPFPCTVCDKAFLTKQKLDEHTNGHTGNAPVKCNLCNETFRRYSNLTQHKNRHHLNIKKKLKDFICHCGEVFHSKKKLAWHKETHDPKPKACSYCNERFIHMASLTRHMRRAHNRRFVPDAQRESENVECPICKCIYLRSSLAVHMRVHNGERPYECQICSKAFSTKWNLQLHKWTHAARSTKPYKCTQCSSAFYRHSDYIAHMNSHRNVRPYTCNYCGAQFIRKYNCLRHVKEHEENKAYTCDVCNKTFHRSYYLKEHLRVHSGARPYTCHICGKSSSTKSNHNKHVRIHHAREPVNTEN